MSVNDEEYLPNLSDVKIDYGRIEQTEKVEQTEQTEKVEQVEQVEQTEKVEQTEQTEKVEQDEQVEQTEKVEQDEQTEKVEQTEQTEQTEKVEQTEQTKKTVVKQKTENKYTKIDNLDEDTPLTYDGKDGNPERLKKPLYGIWSFVTPEGVMNTNLRLFKCRGIFDDENTAKFWAKKIGENDLFDVFVGELYKWLPFDSDTDKATNIQYRNSKEQKLLMQQKENEMNELVGRKKALLEKEKKGSRRRKADRILAGRNETGGAAFSENKENKENKEEKEKKNPIVKVSREVNKNNARERLKKMVSERNKKKEDEEKLLNESKKKQEDNIKSREDELKTKENNLSTLEKNMAEISKRLQ